MASVESVVFGRERVLLPFVLGIDFSAFFSSAFTSHLSGFETGFVILVATTSMDAAFGKRIILDESNKMV